MWCLQFELTTDDIDRLEDMVNRWVKDYEKYVPDTPSSALTTNHLYCHL
jgi:hypothetical protein